MSPIAHLIPERTEGIEILDRVPDLFVPAAPPRPDETAEEYPDPNEDPIVAAAKLLTFVVASGMAAGIGLWAFGSMAFDAVRGLLT